MPESFLLSIEDRDNWNAFLNKLPVNQQDIYFTPDYYRLYENLGDGRANCFVFKKENDLALYPFLINSVNKLGYELDDTYFDIQGAYGYNGVISSNYSDEFIRDFYSAFYDFCDANNIIAEFTRFHPLLKNESFSNKYLNTFFDRKTVYIDLGNEYENIYSDFQKTTKRQIKIAREKHGLTTSILKNDLSFLNKIYEIYTSTLKRVNSIEYLYFNEDYFKNLIELKATFCFVAFLDNQPISFYILLLHSNYIHGHLAGTNPLFLNLSPFGNLYEEMIKFGIMNGCKYLHVGGGATTSENDPVLYYKSHFSKETSDFYIGKKIHNTSVYNQVIEQWKVRNPTSYLNNNKKILGYREI